MKRFILSLLIPMVMAVSAGAMSYEEARQRAWFLTDKMAYELNLTPEQYDRAYQVNLDYLMSLRSPSDYSSGRYWKFRDADLRCILFDWQYSLYASLDYFFRPIRWYVLPGISPCSTVTGAATTILNVQKSMYLTTAVHGTNAATMPEALTGA